MKKQPVFYVEREILKRGFGQSYYNYAYIASKAYLKTKTENYLDDGRIVGMGTHEELLANNEIYQDVYYSQVKGDEDNE